MYNNKKYISNDTSDEFNQYYHYFFYIIGSITSIVTPHNF